MSDQFPDEAVFAATRRDVDVQPACYETCNPDGVAESLEGQLLANYIMNRCFMGGLPNEVTIEVSVACSGPQKRFLRPTACGMKATGRSEAVNNTPSSED